MRSSIRLFIYQKLLVTSAENMSVAFGMNYEDLLPLVYFVHDRGICQLNTDEYKTVRPFVFYKIYTDDRPTEIHEFKMVGSSIVWTVPSLKKIY